MIYFFFVLKLCIIFKLFFSFCINKMLHLQTNNREKFFKQKKTKKRNMHARRTKYFQRFKIQNLYYIKK